MMDRRIANFYRLGWKALDKMTYGVQRYEGSELQLPKRRMF